MVAVAILKKNYSRSIRNFMLLTLITMVLAGYYGYTQYGKLSAAQGALSAGQDMIAALQTKKTEVSGQFDTMKKGFDDKFDTIYSALDTVYPLTEKYTDLARLFDDFVAKNNSSTNPVLISDLKFGQARFETSNDFAVLPVSVTLSGSQDNFIKFLKFIETSGVLEDKTRLMDIRSISINFVLPSLNQGEVLNTKPGINVSINLNAYFQKPYKTVDAAKTTS